MESLLTLSIGEYQSVAIALRVVMVLTAMTAALLALSTGIVGRSHRLPLILAAVGLGGAAWFESGVWLAWQDAFELAGTSYAVTGHLLGDEDRILAWSLGVPLLLLSLGMLQVSSGKIMGSQARILVLAVLVLALVMPFSSFAGAGLFCLIGILLGARGARLPSGKIISTLVLASIGFGILLNAFCTRISLGGGASGELVRGELLRSILELFSLVIPGVLLLIGVLGLSKQESESKS